MDLLFVPASIIDLILIGFFLGALWFYLRALCLRALWFCLRALWLSAGIMASYNAMGRFRTTTSHRIQTKKIKEVFKVSEFNSNEHSQMSLELHLNLMSPQN